MTSLTYYNKAYAASQYRPTRVVRRSVCHSSELRKTAQPIEMTFGLRTRVGLRNHALDGVQVISWEGAILRSKRGGTL